MKTLSILLAAALSGSPSLADTYHHSFPDIGPTGTYCTTYSSGSYGRTTCSRGLTKEEQRIDKIQHQQKIKAGLKKAGLPANYCTTHLEKLFSKLKPWTMGAGNEYVSAAFGLNLERISCEGFYSGTFSNIYSKYAPFAEAYAKREAGCPPNEVYCDLRFKDGKIIWWPRSLQK